MSGGSTRGRPSLPAEAYEFAPRSSGGVHGAVWTRAPVVDLILDLAGYRPDRDLTRQRLLEPACGHGAFLTRAVPRLLEAARRRGRDPGELGAALVAFDVDSEAIRESRAAVERELARAGVEQAAARKLARRWVRGEDFLLAPSPGAFQYAVGNPPYVRIEQLHPQLQEEYRKRCSCLVDRSDLYVPFLARSLELLAPRGVLSMICADRWTANRYGRRLRELIARDYCVRSFLDLKDAAPFEEGVSAYPAIATIARGPQGEVRVAKAESVSTADCARLRDQLLRGVGTGPGPGIERYPEWFRGGEPWVLTSPSHLQVLRRLEESFPALEDSGSTRVGIGVATGCDRVFVVESDADVEPDRLLPLAVRGDVENGVVVDRGRRLLQPFGGDGRCVDLRDYPRLARYLQRHAPALRQRYVARQRPDQWFRTIDPIHPELLSRQKLLIPDIAGSLEVAYDPGRFYPHHNLYYVISEAWDLEVLGGLLSSRVALFCVWSYAVKMRGGYLRFQAQYLRRIRVPRPGDLSPTLKRSLQGAFRRRDFAALDLHALEAWQLDELPAFDFVDTRR